ncbi:peptidoglycan-binding domain-containing protein [Paractinoplanes atraurantiacus]|uniref:Putative peptidoglycan binding domain-containing protein n=1 Tax=Paractinoplanes atraurantiacus TaxID=1036182 RepID=A0A285J594_9ACTN|nr:peptidoglycan-binding domain-containing protein [Actinoplanes atraurantiacus]SNY55233.1 Putative peptidoglycan binding domain-containing protein [Actinoplanes atraurantiacus]
MTTDQGIDVTTTAEDDNAELLIGPELTEAESRTAFAPDDSDASTEDEARMVRIPDADLAAPAGPALRVRPWHLARSLARLRAEIDQRWPNRDRKSDGSIGDKDHEKTASDHNPNGRSSVNAIDTDKDGISPMTLVEAAKRHPACNYVIFNRVIYTRDRGFRAHRYSGPNPHTQHIHVSILQNSAAEESTRPWGIAQASFPAFPGTLRRGSRGSAVKTLQTRLNERGFPRLGVDGEFGPATEDRVKAFQRFAKIAVDGIAGPVTWRLLWTLPR